MHPLHNVLCIKLRANKLLVANVINFFIVFKCLCKGDIYSNTDKKE